MQCTNRLLPLCTNPARMSRDGWAGPNASIYLPFFGRYFFSGAQYVFPGGTVPQSRQAFLAGSTKPNTYTKYNGFCGEGV